MKTEQSTEFSKDNIVIPIETRQIFENVLKKGIYIQLYNKNMLSESQLNYLLKTYDGNKNIQQE